MNLELPEKRPDGRLEERPDGRFTDAKASERISDGVAPDQRLPFENLIADDEWDAGDLGCGEIIILLRRRMQGLGPGGVLKLTARDQGAPADLPAWCRMTGRRLLHAEHPEYWIQQ